MHSITSVATHQQERSANTTLEGSYKVDELQVALKEFVPVATQKAAEQAAPVSVKQIVEEKQRNSPHGTAELSQVVQALAAATQKAVSAGPAGIAEVLKAQNLAAVYSSESESALSTNNEGHYTVYFSAKDGLVTYGVYQKATTHRIEFNLANEVTAAGYDLVAAAFARAGKFTFSTRHGAVSFGAEGVVEADAVPSVESESLLAVKAPLAFFA